MAEYLIQEETLTGIANKIRALNDSVDTMSPLEMQSTLDALNTEIGNIVADQSDLLAEQEAKMAELVQALSGKAASNEVIEYSEAEDAMITRTLTEYRNDRVHSIAEDAFQEMSTLVSVDFMNVDTIGSFAFQLCSNLTTANFYGCTDIGLRAFCSCFNLINISFPACKSIGQSAFYLCQSLTTASFPACVNVGSYAFQFCDRMRTADFPSCKNIYSDAFYACYNLTTINFPNCVMIGSRAFGRCSGLTTINFPNCTSISSAAFDSCNELMTASFPVCTSITGYWAFAQCYNLSSLTLGASTVCTLSHSNAFNSTPYKGYSASFSGQPWIYVPSSLVASYQVAKNWSYFSSYFSAIESLG